MSASAGVRYEPHEKPPHALAAGLGAQVVLLIIAGIMITPLVVARAAGLTAAETSWLVFAALLAAGLSTWLQMNRLGIIGSGYVLFVGSNVAFVSVATAAIKAGGLPLLASLGAFSALVTFLFTWKLGALRRILTPAVGGTVMMLMALSVAPVVWGMLKKAPPAFQSGSALPAVMVCTIVPIVLVSLFAKGMLRLWAPLIGVAVGTVISAGFGLVDGSALAAAPWIGLPVIGWPGVSLEFGPEFWALLPAFAMISMVACIETFADSISVQRSSHREEQPIDFRRVQGSINADGAGSFIAALLGTVPNTVYSASVSVMELTGVAARRVGAWGGLFLVLLAFSPKVAAAVAAVPSIVAGSYIFVLLSMLFGHGVRMVAEGDLAFEEGLAVFLGFWVGIGFQGGFLFNERLPEWANIFLSNGTTSGGLTAMLLMGLLSLRQRSRDHLHVPLEPRSIATLRPVVQAFARRLGWDATAENRLMLACEEAMLFLLEAREGDGADKAPGQVHVRFTNVQGEAEAEFVCAPTGVNIEAAAAAMPAAGDAADPGIALSLRLLRGMTRELRHLQYHGVDYLTFKVDSRC
ncbi:MAG: hypothetical protein RL026_2052 [Pseudomonadota bacterium]